MEWSLLAGLSAEEQRSVLAQARRRRFAKNEVVFHEGDPADSLHLIASGRVAVRSTTPLGDAATLAVLGPGDAFGEQALMVADAKRSATVRALETTETLSVTRDQFDALRTKHKAIDRFLTAVLSSRVERLSEHLMEALFVPVEKRVVRRLLALSRQYDAGQKTIVIPLPQEDLAGLAGSTRPTVNKVLRKLEDAGALALNRGRIEILDRAALGKRAR
jgi:CRP-like cAMP-binding protein